MRRAWWWLLATALPFAVAACGGGGTQALRKHQAALEASSFWSPGLLYTAPSPYRSLRVEIDCVAGSQPDPRNVERLREFLEAQCEKPGGVEVVIDDIIPAEAARGRHSRWLALKHIDGPKRSDQAFVYMLFFNGRQTTDRVEAPRATLLPYPSAVYVDTAYRGYSRSKPEGFPRYALIHELGHTLGLARNPSHTKALHCENEGCLMQAGIVWNFSKAVVGKSPWENTELCGDCLDDLAEGRTRRPSANLRFHGPYLARREQGYWVLSLPGYIYVQDGELSSLDEGRLADLRAQTLAEGFTDGAAFRTSEMELDVAREIAPALRRDPVEGVRVLGEELVNYFANEDEARP